jgi:hypothetical protein
MAYTPEQLERMKRSLGITNELVEKRREEIKKITNEIEDDCVYVYKESANSGYQFGCKDDAPRRANTLRELAEKCVEEYYGPDVKSRDFANCISPTHLLTDHLTKLADDEWDDFLRYFDEFARRI